MRTLFTDISYINDDFLHLVKRGKKQLNIRALALVVEQQNKLIDEAHFQAFSMC
jgi:hypothetical protein